MLGCSRLVAASALACGTLIVAGQAQAAVFAPFASYTMKSTRTTIDWKLTGPLAGTVFSTLPGGSTPGSPTVTFNFLDTSKYLDHLTATLKLSGSEAGVMATGGTHDIDQSGIGGSFMFLYTGPTQSFMGKTYVHNVTNLLSGVFTLARITGSGTSGALHDSSDIGTVKFSSDIISVLPFAKTSDFSYSLVSVAPPFGHIAGDSANSFKAGATGIFSAGFVPEPATWAMMITGLGLLGVAARRRRALGAA
jgi:hypothetical protein